jgi:hypothetical protein
MAVSYAWRNNNACVATYKVLSSDIFLDQFEGSDIPFDAAGAVALGSLRYFPKTTINPEIVSVLSMEIARRYVGCVTKLYTVNAEKGSNSAAVVAAIAAVLANPKLTIADLAAVTDSQIRFPDEA